MECFINFTEFERQQRKARRFDTNRIGWNGWLEHLAHWRNWKCPESKFPLQRNDRHDHGRVLDDPCWTHLDTGSDQLKRRWYDYPWFGMFNVFNERWRTSLFTLATCSLKYHSFHECTLFEQPTAWTASKSGMPKEYLTWLKSWLVLYALMVGKVAKLLSLFTALDTMKYKWTFF